MNVRVRLAPSPTGPLHVGTARTALFNFLFARRHGGQFILRLEDTDTERSRQEYEQEILDGLRWLSLKWDEGPDVSGPHAPYRQSERQAHYDAALQKLLREGKAYEREGAVYLAVGATGDITVHDLVRGDVVFPSSTIGDFVIAKPASGPGGVPLGHPTESRSDSLGTPAPRIREANPKGTPGGGFSPLFHLAVVVDDAAMGITHVIRGEDHLSNTPRHLLLQRALGVATPQYAHVPLLLDRARKKLSKRTLSPGVSPDDVRLLSYRDRGYAPEALVNFLALLGWNPKTTVEVLTVEELVRSFDLNGIQRGGAVFELEKLAWLQREHLRRLPRAELIERATAYYKQSSHPIGDQSQFARAVKVWGERGGPFSELPDATRYRVEAPRLVTEEIPWRGTSSKQAEDGLAFATDVLEKIPAETWESLDALRTTLTSAIDGAGKDPASPVWLRGGDARGTVLWPLRYALCGRRESPGPGELAWVLGKRETLRRAREAQRLVS